MRRSVSKRKLSMRSQTSRQHDRTLSSTSMVRVFHFLTIISFNIQTLIISERKQWLQLVPKVETILPCHFLAVVPFRLWFWHFASSHLQGKLPLYVLSLEYCHHDIFLLCDCNLCEIPLWCFLVESIHLHAKIRVSLSLLLHLFTLEIVNLIFQRNYV